MRSRTGGRGEPGPASTGDPRWLSLYDRLDTSLVKATGSLGSWGLHSEHLEINTGAELMNCRTASVLGGDGGPSNMVEKKRLKRLHGEYGVMNE